MSLKRLADAVVEARFPIGGQTVDDRLLAGQRWTEFMQAADVHRDRAERYLRRRCLRLCGPRR